MRGDGFTYKQGNRWWVGFRAGGKLHRKAAKLPDKEGVLRPAKNEAEARRFLKAQRAAVLGGRFLTADQERITVGELLDAVEARAKARGLRSLKKLSSHAKALRDSFALVRAVDVTPAQVELYKANRRAEGRAAATINRELEILRHAYRLGVKGRRISPERAPDIELLPVDNVREGYFTADDLAALLPHLEDEDLRDFVAWGFYTGMRKSEAAELTWKMLDRRGPTWTLRIPASIVKNKGGRTLPVVGTVKTIMERRLRARRLDCRLIFHRVSKGKPGQPIKAFDKAWRNALREAGLPKGRLYHDLRRSAARNLRLAGASETEAMKVTGHKTPSMFRRYSIVTDEEAAAALLKVDALLGRQQGKP